MKRMTLMVMMALVAASLPSCLEDIEETPLMVEEENLQAPAGIRTVTGDGQIIVSWYSVGDAASYRLYRSATLGEIWVRLVETTDTIYADEEVSNGIQYLYAVSSVAVSGIESGRSEPSAATPSVFSVLINGGFEFAGSREVTLALTAPSTTTVMRISNEPDLENVPWEAYSPERAWFLEEGDGLKTVYVSFQNAVGSLSPTVSSTIELDTYAGIEALTITPEPHIYSPGDQIHLILEVEDDEPGGTAYVDIEDLTTGPVQLRDDGKGGDAVAGDGIYEEDFSFPTLFRGTNLIAVGTFIDRAGNEAAPLEWDERISFTDPPQAVYLVGSIDSTTTMITIKWEESEEENFLAYRIYRDAEAGVTDDPALFVQGLDFQTQTTYPDGDLMEGRTYYYRIFVINDLGEASGSNEIAASTFDAYPTPSTLSDPSRFRFRRVQDLQIDIPRCDGAFDSCGEHRYERGRVVRRHRD
jgi:hypothetical protein